VARHTLGKNQKVLSQTYELIDWPTLKLTAVA
jgi:hypothetical protein